MAPNRERKLEVVETDTSPNPTKRPPWLPIAIGLGLLVAAVVGGIIWFFGGDAPDAVDLEQTASAADDTSAAETAGAADGIEGTWAVDTGVGEFSVTEETTATFAGFRVEEVLTTLGSTTAVGRTPAVTGSIDISGTTLESAEIVADLTEVVSDQQRREGAIQRTLATSANPNATFVLTEPVELGEGAAAGEPVSVTAVGELTVNGTTNQVEIPLEAQLVDGAILVTGSTEIEFADYGVPTPSAPIVISVEDHGILEFQVWLAS
jgi:polyisoprenoid-binding protein YceI